MGERRRWVEKGGGNETHKERRRRKRRLRKGRESSDALTCARVPCDVGRETFGWDGWAVERKMSREKGYLETSPDPEDQGHAFGNAHEIHPASD